MRRLLQQGLPETLFFIVVIYMLVFLQAGLPAEATKDAVPKFFLSSALIYFFLGLASGFPVFIKRVSREGLGVEMRLLVLPGFVVLYVALLPYLVAVRGLNLPDFALGEGLFFASRASAVWLGTLVSRSLVRDPERTVSYLRTPYQL